MFNPNAFYNDEQWQDIVRRCTKLPSDRVYMVMPRNQGKTMFLNMMKKLEELQKMIKIDETKQYKFSEIVRMVEDGELPEGTKVAASGVFDYLLVGKGSNVNKLYNADGNDIAMFNLDMLFSRLWTIKFPKEDKFYLKAPDCFGEYDYLNYNSNRNKYEFNSNHNDGEWQTKFTQSEISALPFKTSFFKKIKADEE
ncbi:hypothetical protein [Carnobacterium divergens]|uniref:hypothetical protein n=1 Tax=Carnobacterium divergens TaxID=2748 RepID=UPI0028927A7B|nr:hypothetical protein [Carnobacterium divergens]MDT2011215.1 hypothetical protein [Carnobacterium divergens]